MLVYMYSSACCCAQNITAGVRNPVMVFFHGGGYVSGGSMQYPGHFLARDGVVVVTVNYRIGHLGKLL
jgi:para-nitrobenzyl esterase